MKASLRRWGLTAFVVLSITGAALTDRFAPASPWLPAADRPAEPGGAWACPFLKAAGSPGWLHFANFGRVASHVRVTYLPDRKAPVVQAFDIGPDAPAPSGRLRRSVPPPPARSWNMRVATWSCRVRPS